LKTKNLIYFWFLLINIFFVSAQFIYAQNQPDFFRGVDSLAEFIASDSFGKINGTDLDRIDIIFIKSILINHDTSDALLSAAFGCLPFLEFPVRTPFLKIKFGIPLPSGPVKFFPAKSRNLPKNFLFDSPPGFGDRDKLSHFFGSAFLTYNFGFFTITKFMGILVELFENNFKENGEINLRDMQVNYLGGLFGLILRNYPSTKPSDLLKIYNIFYLRVF